MDVYARAAAAADVEDRSCPHLSCLENLDLTVADADADAVAQLLAGRAWQTVGVSWAET